MHVSVLWVSKVFSFYISLRCKWQITHTVPHTYTSNEWFYVTWFFSSLLSFSSRFRALGVGVNVHFYGNWFLWIESNVPIAFWPNRENRFLKPPEKVQYSRLNFPHQSYLYVCKCVRMCIRLIVFLRRDSCIIFLVYFLSLFFLLLLLFEKR